MENGLKALYMVIGVFLGLLILTLFVYVFNKGSDFLSNVNDKEINRQIDEYNSDLAIYNKENNTIFDVISACNLAYDINQKNDYDNVNFLEITVNILGTEYRIANNEALASGKIYNGAASIDLTTLIEIPIGTDGTIGEAINTGVDNKQRQYRYIFEGNLHYSDSTGKIDRIEFIGKPNPEI